MKLEVTDSKGVITIVDFKDIIKIKNISEEDLFIESLSNNGALYFEINDEIQISNFDR